MKTLYFIGCLLIIGDAATTPGPIAAPKVTNSTLTPAPKPKRQFADWKILKGGLADYYDSVPYTKIMIKPFDHGVDGSEACGKWGGCSVPQFQIVDIKYQDGDQVRVVSCGDKSIEEDELAFRFGILPKFLRERTKCITNKRGGVFTGDRGHLKLAGKPGVDVLAHEAGHIWDGDSNGGYRISDRKEFHVAMDTDACLAFDGLYFELFTELVRHMLVAIPQDKKIDCLKGQWNYVLDWLPRGPKGQALPNLKPEFRKGNV